MKDQTKIEKRQVSGSLSTDLNDLFDYLCDTLKLKKEEQIHHAQIKKGDIKIAALVRFLQFNELNVFIDFKNDKITVYYELTVVDSAPEVPEPGINDDDEKIADWLKD